MPIKFDYRKNLLDLNYQKYLQYKIATLIFIFTYFIAVIIAFLTEQLKIDDKIDLIFMGIFSVAFIVIGYLLLENFNFHLKKFPN